MPVHRLQLHELTRRLSRRSLLAAFAGFTLAGCQRNTTAAPEGKTMSRDKQEREVVYFDVNLKSYLERPIFDVLLNGVDIGVADGPPHLGNGGLMAGVAVPLGPQVVSWRLGGPEGMPGNGDIVKAANHLILTRPAPKLVYLGVHIYPDNTVELIPVEYWPERTEYGEEVVRQQGKRYGK